MMEKKESGENIHTNSGINGIASYLNDNGYTKKLRQNNTIPGFSSSFVKSVPDNPVYMGKMIFPAYRIGTLHNRTTS